MGSRWLLETLKTQFSRGVQESSTMARALSSMGENSILESSREYGQAPTSLYARRRPMAELAFRFTWNSPSADLGDRLPARRILALRTPAAIRSRMYLSARNLEWMYWLAVIWPKYSCCSVS